MARGSVLVFALLLAGCVGPPPHGPAGDGGGMHEAGEWPLHSEDRSVDGLPAARPTEEVRLADGARYTLTAGLVRHDVGTGREVRMLAYNGQIPGPTLRIPQGANVTVVLENDLPFATTVHWHGLRLDPAMDGVPGLSQEVVPPGGSFAYALRAPDEGTFWYHTHVREDYQQELGLYGALLVDGPRAAEEPWPRDLVVLLDDVLVEDGDIAPFGPEADHVLMGRFGNVLLTNGAPSVRATGAPGERVRVHLVDVANVRPFLVFVDGARQAEIVGVGSGYYRAPQPVRPLVLAPAERAVVDVVLPDSGNVTFVHEVAGRRAELLRIDVDAAASRVEDTGAPRGPHERAAADLEGALRERGRAASVRWDLDFRILDLGLGLAGGHNHHHGAPAGGLALEWEDGMAAVNANSTPAGVQWVIRDPDTLAENMELAYTWPRGSLVDVTIHNKPASIHPMQHPIHLHGQRFLVRTVDGAPVEPVWRDTVLVPTGARILLTVEASNPGTWLFHCHISEHMEGGMMGTFTVT